ncbi:hypothetical protein Pan216_06970 [Planctomycetes bacterium Pan216]|uniref:AsmA-like C-terminal domain-containing protein n=1 Tax=Kolteria novifilia TaxID=2527975 RepID=A0A518AYR5_9BACT|nr:hypothetical protein Pan216_06970 [Planctomycetes bacterium Pan216]
MRRCVAILSLLVLASPLVSARAEAASISYQNWSFSQKDVDLGLLATRLGYIGVKIPFAIEGTLSYDVQVGVPWGALRDAKAYRFNGTASSTKLTIEGIELVDLKVRAAFRDGILTLDELRTDVRDPTNTAANAPVGKATGTAKVGLVPLEQLTASIQLTEMPIPTLPPELAKAVAGDGGEPITIAAQFSLLVADLSEIQDGVSGKVTGKEIRVGPVQFSQLRFDVSTANDTVTVTDFYLDSSPGNVTGSGAWPLKPNGKGNIALTFDDFGWSEKVGDGFFVDLSGHIQGKLNADIGPADRAGERPFSGNLDISVPDFELGSVPVTEGHIAATLDDKDAKYDLKAGFSRGTVDVSGQVNLGAEVEDLVQGKATIKGVQLQPIFQTASQIAGLFAIEGRSLLRPVRGSVDVDASYRVPAADWSPVGDGTFALENFAWLGIPLVGLVSGDVSLAPGRVELDSFKGSIAGGQLSGRSWITYPRPTKKGPEGTWNFDASLNITRFVIPFAILQNMEITAHSVEKQVEYNILGSVLGGSLRVDGKAPWVGAGDAWKGGGKIRLKGLNLSQVAQTGPNLLWLQAMRGTAGLDFDYTQDAAFTTTGRGRANLSGLAWGNIPVSNRLEGMVSLTNSILSVQDMTGIVSGGLARVNAKLDLVQWNRSEASLAAQDVRMSPLLSGWWEPLGVYVDAMANLRVDARFHNALLFTGRSQFTQGHILGIDLTRWDVPFAGGFSFLQSTGRVDIPESLARFAGGRVHLKGQLMLGQGLGMSGSGTFDNLDLPTIFRHAMGITQLDHGIASGTFNFKGSNVRTIRDIEGTLGARIAKADAFDLPILDSITPFLEFARISGSTLGDGALQANLKGGILAVRSGSVTTRTVRLFFSGLVTLPGGGLALKANAGPIFPIPILQQRVDNLVRLNVGGTVYSPQVRVTSSF